MNKADVCVKELACAFNRLGFDVTLDWRTKRMDAQCSATFRPSFIAGIVLGKPFTKLFQSLWKTRSCHQAGLGQALRESTG